MKLYMFAFIFILFDLFEYAISKEAFVNLEKYGKDNFNWDDYYIIFDSKEFDVGEEIYFKLTSTCQSENYISYEFFDNYIAFEEKVNENKSWPWEFDSKYLTIETDSSTNLQTKYYTIKKDQKILDHLGVKGDYLSFVFYYYDCGTVTIENTKENEGDVTMIVIIVVVVVAVLAIIAIIIYCWRKKKMLKAMKASNQVNQQQVYTANNKNYNNYGTNNNDVVYSNLNDIPDNNTNNYGYTSKA